MYFRCIAQSQCVLKVLILRGAVPVDMHTTAFLLTYFLFFMFLVQCLKLTYVCLFLSVLMLISLHLNLALWPGWGAVSAMVATISLSKTVGGRC